MTANQQHMLDVYRAARLGELAPPAPGIHDWQVFREVRDHQRSRAAVAGRPVRTRRLRAVLAGLFASSAKRSPGPPPGCARPVAGTGSGARG
ncbi:hypothetical protein AS594_15705 [Streptomyces agglomeratus]|uniref:Uncharacterized protein n=1 Tax=Streptomyces agglomeratus TaxID=285458 RepID=A0A1E5PIZ1_9ACTN|nr:hypothetical protein [Streptomyces agglomeratus]OEJ29472.1 hypothetical protein AS594_15705 [Streptomyces agglomeratus]OEJ55831.1 hypothetical protein BGK72_20415 [Streptomyces agglomeratus]